MTLGKTVLNTFTRFKTQAFLCATSLLFTGYANAIPDGGTVSQEILTLPVIEEKVDQELPLTPATAVVEQEQANTFKVLINNIVFEGASVLSLTALEAEVSDALGEMHSFVGLKRLAAQIQGLYQESGYMMAQAYLPEQNLKTGTLRININEGSLDEVNIEQGGKLKRTVTEKYVDSLKGNVINSEALERTIRLLSDLPATEARFVFDPSVKDGYADLSITTTDAEENIGYLSVDNHGNRFVGASRISGQYNLNNTLGYGEQFTFNAASSGKGYNYVALGAALPLGGNGLMLSSRISATQYELGETFAALDADGDNQEVSVELRYPVIRSLNKNLNIAAELKHQKFNDNVGATSFFTTKSLDSLLLKAGGNYINSTGNSTRWNLDLSVGNVSLDNAALSNDSYGTDGHFTKLNGELNYRHLLTDKWAVSVKAQGQLAGSNLDSAVKMQLGGSNTVRAYPQGEATVDSGLVTSLELSYQKNERLTLAGFFDAGVGKEHKSELSTDTSNTKRLSGVGVKADWLIADKLVLSSSIAWRTEAEPVSDTRDLEPRYWLQLTHYF